MRRASTPARKGETALPSPPEAPRCPEFPHAMPPPSPPSTRAERRARSDRREHGFGGGRRPAAAKPRGPAGGGGINGGGSTNGGGNTNGGGRLAAEEAPRDGGRGRARARRGAPCATAQEPAEVPPRRRCARERRGPICSRHLREARLASADTTRCETCPSRPLPGERTVREAARTLRPVLPGSSQAGMPGTPGGVA